MTKETTETLALKEAQESLKRLQDFDASTLPQKDQLGAELNFSDAVPYARKLVDLFNQISLTSLVDLPKVHLDAIKNQADATFNRFDEILTFSQKEANAFDRHRNLLQQLETAYDGVFNKIHPLVSYSTSRSADFKALETQSRATFQTIKDEAEILLSKLEEDKSAANFVLADKQYISKLKPMITARKQVCGTREPSIWLG